MRFYQAWVTFEDGRFRFIELEASSEANAKNILSRQFPSSQKIDVDRVK